MATLDPNEAFEHLRDQTIRGITASFPVKARGRVLDVEDLHVDEPEDGSSHPDNIRSQYEAKTKGKSWTVPLSGRLVLKDVATGRVLESKKVRLAEIPKMTRRYSYILDGQEYQVDNQWQLKSGVYGRRRQNGELEARFNVVGAPAFDMVFDPASKLFKIDYKKAKIPAYPLMKALGASDEDLSKSWGQSVFEANKNAARSAGAVEQFFKTSTGRAPQSPQEATDFLKAQMESAKMRPEVNEMTLGKPFGHVTHDTLHRAANKLLAIQGGAPEDNRDSLIFKTLRSTGDYVREQIERSGKTIAMKLQRQMMASGSQGLRDVGAFGVFNAPIRQVFLKSSLSNPAKQINPIEMVSSAMQTTIMGPGGIQSEESVTNEAKMIDPTHLAFLDAINTPEGCFDRSTEVFTSKGWVGWPQVTDDTLLACIDQDTQTMTFKKPLRLWKQPHKGVLLSFAHPCTAVTMAHGMWAKNVGAAHHDFERIPAEELIGRSATFRIGGVAYEGNAEDAPSNERLTLNDLTLPIRLWVDIVRLFLEAGRITGFSVNLPLTNLTPEDRLAFEQQLTEARIEYMPGAISVHKGDFMAGSVHLQTRALVELLDRRLSDVFEAFLALPARVRAQALPHLTPYRTPVRGRALLVDALCASLGMASFLDTDPEGYVVLATGDDEFTVAGHEHKQVEYDGYVYCATVPGELLLVRRKNDIPIWCGNSKTGVTLRLPSGVKKVGDEVMVPVVNLKTNKTEYIPPKTFFESKVVLADQLDYSSGRPVPLHKEVQMAGAGNEIIKGKFEDADYALRHPSQLFNLTSNLIPFLPNDSGNRASMAARHMEQSISLVHRQAPLVQVSTPTPKGAIKTFEQFMGMQVAHHAPVDGTVSRITPDAIFVKDKSGTEHEVHIYNHYPLNDAKSLLHSTPLEHIKPGTKVKAGETLADTNYAKNGVLAPGTNLDVAYLPYKGYNFEDGVVISESAAKKLSSEHMHKHSLESNEKMVHDPKFFRVTHMGTFTPSQFDKLGADGVVQVGQRVEPGDPLILASQPYDVKQRTGAAALRKSMQNQHVDRSVKWHGDYGGEVVAVHRAGDRISVHVKTIEPMQVGDKISARHGNKGIVSKILPDHEMPHTVDDKGKPKPLDVLLNPSGVPGRMNIGQVLETVAGKIARKTGKTYVVDNFDPKIPNMLEKVKLELKQHGLSDTEEVFDPLTGKSLGQITVGPQHMIKLVHQVEKKRSARAGMTLPGMVSEEGLDTSTLQPSSGGHAGGQSTGALGIFALLAHGATANLREMQTYKSEGEDPQTDVFKRWPSQHNEVWKAIQEGMPLPPPKPTFAFHRFTQMLKGAGINVEKKGHELVLGPITDKHVLQMSAGELTQPSRAVESKIDPNTGEYKPIKGGLFDEKLTGGHGGTKWSHIKLAEPIPNPVFEEAIKKLTNLKGHEYDAIVAGEKAVTPTGEITSNLKLGLTGGKAIQHMLEKIDVQHELERAKRQLNAAKPADVDKSLKKVKYLKALAETGLKPSEAYVLNHLPVLPPAIRPVSKMQEGVVKFEDVNGLYMKFAQVNEQLADPILSANLTDARKKELRAAFYDGVKAITGIDKPEKDDGPKGLLEQISGSQPKEGYFQKSLINRRQDLTMRSTIVPEPALGLDEVGLPKHEAFKTFMPFVVRKLVEQGTASTPLQAQKVLSEHLQGTKHDKAVDTALELVMQERPVLLKRDPVLHKYGIQAFKARPVEGNAIKIHPLTCGGFNADFDGDFVLGRILVFVPKKLMGIGIENGSVPAQNKAMVRWPTMNWWRERRLPDSLQTYYRSLTNAPVGSFYAIDLGELPRTDTSFERKGISVHMVPQQLQVIGFDQESRSYKLAEIQYWTRHRPRPVHVVMLEDGRMLVTDDDPRAVYGLDSSNQFVRARPSEAALTVPTAGPFREVADTSLVALRLPDEDDITLQAQVELDGNLGYMFGAFVSTGQLVGTNTETRQFEVQGTTLQMDRFAAGVASCCLCPDVIRTQVAQTRSFPSASMVKRLSEWISLEVPSRHLPPFFAWAPLLFRIGLLEGLLDGAGKLTSDGASATIRCLNVRMGYEVAELLRGMGIFGVLESDQDGWRVRMNVRELALIEPELHNVKGKLFACLPDRLRGRSKLETKQAAVEAYHPSEHSAEGYDITVPGTETFLDAQGVVRSNTMAVFTPITQAAVDEAHRMLPSSNIFNEATGKVMFTPTLEAALGAYKLSLVGKDSGKIFADKGALMKALDAGHVKHDDVVQLAGMKTTPGRVLIANVLPEPMQKKVLTDLDLRINKKGLGDLLHQLGKEHRHDFGRVVNDLKDLGNDASFGIIRTKLHPDPIAIGAHTLALKDFEPDITTREGVLKDAHRRAEEIRNDPKIPQSDKDRRIVQVYLHADEQIVKEHDAKMSTNPSNLFLMSAAGTKPDKNQYKQMITAPMIVKNSKNEFVPRPITKSYAEGLTLGAYWDSLAGARRGSVMKVQEVQEPGYMSKLLQNTAMGMQIDKHDCKTARGVLLSVQEKDVHDRYLAADYKNGQTHLPSGTLLTSRLIGEIRAADPNAKLVVRSPLKCDSEKGVCQVCGGLNVNGEHHHIGTNLGVQAAHAVGERAVQLTLKAFHTGGVAELGGGSKALNSFARFEQLVKLNKKIPNAATLSMVSGTIDKVLEEPTGVKVFVNGKAHFVGKDDRGMPLHQELEGASGFKDYKPWSPPKVGDKVVAGQPLSDPNRTTVNPHDLYRATKSMDVVQNHLADEIYSLYKGEDVKRRAVEALVRAMGNVSKVDDPGDHPDILRGEFYPTSYLQSLNKDLKGKKPIVHAPVLKGVDMLPFVVSDDPFQKLQHQRLKTTLREGAAQAQSAKIHSSYPITGLAYGAEFGLPQLAKPIPGRPFDAKPHHY